MTPRRPDTAKNKPKNEGLHPRNLHRQGYEFSSLVDCYPLLAPYVQPNIAGKPSIDFANPQAVKALNTALLRHYYNIAYWDIPEGSLCPPIPGRADYIHYIADLLGLGEHAGNPKTSQTKITLLDIGTGANGVYPLLAIQIYGWDCVGSDINPDSLKNVTSIIAHNPGLKDCFSVRTQHNKHHIFEGIIQKGERFDVSVCNPPFHASLDEALQGNKRKLIKLARNKAKPSHTRNDAREGRDTDKAPTAEPFANTSHHAPVLNFGGCDAELWCKGGERMFLKKLIRESATFATQCRWFTSLVSKSDNVKPAIKWIRKLGATDIREIEMTQGNKITRVLAWTYL